MDAAEQKRQFAEWLNRHGAMVHQVVNAFAEGDDRNDLLQEVLVAVWKSIPAFRGQAKPTTYQYRVCHNAAIHWLRTEKNYRKRVTEFGDLSATTAGGTSDPKTEERLRRLYSAIHGLRPFDRSLILLALDGLSYRDMAEVLGLSETNIGVKLNRIKNQLTENLKGDDHEL